MRNPSIRKIIELVAKAQTLANSLGIPNLLQPGLIKEMIIAEALGHRLIFSKRGADACDPKDDTVLYEYLSCKEGGSGQMDRMFKAPPEKRMHSIARITRNRKVFFAVFFKDQQMKIKAIYEIDPSVVLAEVERRLDRSKNDISHIGIPISWAARHGNLVHQSNQAH